jgi:predicted GNAT superfamily acetyltransferase
MASITFRSITTEKELQACIELQAKIWGLGPDGCDSLITLKVLSMESPPMGLVMGAFDGDRMVGLVIYLPTRSAGCLYGHMLGMLPEYRDAGIGFDIQRQVLEWCRSHDVVKLVWTYEPLEGRNAQLYLNRFGACVVAYKPDCFVVEDEMNSGMPIDRFLVEQDLLLPRTQACLDGRYKAPELSTVLGLLPVAQSGSMPDADRILVQIPGDLQVLKQTDRDAAIAMRQETRLLFSEYINRRGYRCRTLISGQLQGERQNYYLLERE